MPKFQIKIIAYLFSFSLVVASAGSVNAAVNKVGGNCAKKAAVVKVGSQSLICVLKGKKLVWALNPAPVKESSTPAQPPKEVSTPTKILFTSREGDSCRQGDIKAGYAQDNSAVILDCGPDGKLHPYQNGRYKVNEYTGKVLSAYNFNQFPAEVKNVFSQAWKEVQDAKYPGAPLVFNIAYQSEVPQSHRAIFEASAQVMNDHFSGWAKLTKDVYWIVATDKSWAIDQVKVLGAKLGATESEINSYIDVLKNGTIRFKSFSDPLALMIGAQSTGQNGRLAGKPVQVFDSWPTYQGNYFDWHEATHEVFHPLVEDYLLPTRPNALPCWFTEGSASLIGESFGPAGMSFESQFSRFLSHGGGRTGSGFTWGGDLEFPGEINCSQHSQVYTEGEVITTFLVGLYGWDKFAQFIKVPSGSDWKSHFSTVYGIPVNDFYFRIQPMIKSIYQWLDSQ